MDTKNFWDKFYSNNMVTTSPSNFAKYCLDKLDRSLPLIELGCGNGRDALFFARNGVKVIGYDQSQKAIDSLDGVHPNLTPICLDFTKLPTKECGSIYARFVFHAITEKEELTVLRWAHRSLLLSGRIFIETRGLEDPFYGLGYKLDSNSFVYQGHYRRFNSLEQLAAKLNDSGFNIEHKEESVGLAVYGEEDPKIIRIVATKK